MGIFEQAGWTRVADAVDGTTVGESYSKKPLHLWVSEHRNVKITAALPGGLLISTHVAMPANVEDLRALEGRVLIAKMGAEMMIGCNA